MCVLLDDTHLALFVFTAAYEAYCKESKELHYSNGNEVVFGGDMGYGGEQLIDRCGQMVHAEAVHFDFFLSFSSSSSRALPPKPLTQIEKALSLLEELHQKVDNIPKCECSSLRQELEELKKTLTSPPPSDTYSTVKKALNDASVYADKSTRAVWIGREESLSPTDTLSSDEQAVQDLCAELNDDVITKALKDGNLRHKRHPEVKGDRKKRPMKLQFESQKIRDHFLSLIRSSRPPTVTKSGGAFIRRDLCPFELEMERQARINAWKNNIKMGALAYGVRDDKMIKFTVTPRLLPNGYANRPPRGSLPDKTLPIGSPSLSLNSSILNQSNISQSLHSTNHDNSILASVTPMMTRSTAATTVPSVNSKAQV